MKVDTEMYSIGWLLSYWLKLRTWKTPNGAEFFVPHRIYLENLQNNLDEIQMDLLFNGIGYTQQYVGKYDMAIKYYEKSLQINPEDADSIF